MYTPENNLMVAFWKCLRDDLTGRGCTTDSLPANQRKLPYFKRVRIERRRLQNDAQLFIDSDDFNTWSVWSGFDSDYLRERFNGISY